MKPPESSHERRHSRAPSLDFLRGIAICAVMGFHFKFYETGNTLIAIIEAPIRRFGQEGVNLFFTLSGFLVGGLLIRQQIYEGRIGVRKFLARRILRIWPAYYALVLFHVIAGRHPIDSFLLQNAFHLQNFLGSSLAQTWSLAVEEHFYILLPFLLRTLFKVKSFVVSYVAIVGICFLVLILRCIAVSAGLLDAVFLQTQFRIDSLLIGVLLALVYWKDPGLYETLSRNRFTVPALGVLFVWLGVFKSFEVLDRTIGFTVQSLGYAAAIMFALKNLIAFQERRWFKFVSWVGTYSYGIYLWHSSVLAPAERLIGMASAWRLHPIVAWTSILVLQLFFALLIGYVVTKAIEAPCLRLREKFLPDRPS